MADTEDFTAEEQPIDPLEHAAATTAIINQMRQEEAALTPGGRFTPPAAPVSAPLPALAVPGQPANSQGMPLHPTGPLAYIPGQPQGPNPSVQIGGPKQVPVEPPMGDPRAMMAQQQYEANRGYQADIDRGVSPQVAMAKWGPAMFGPKAAPSVQPPASKLMNVSGRLYRVDQAGAVPITPEKPVHRPPVKDEVLIQDMTDLRKAINNIETAVAKGDRTAASANRVLPGYRAQLDALRTRFYQQNPQLNKTGTSVVAPPEGVVGDRKEIIRLTKDGKRAVFDSTTKKFIRYAD